MIVLLRFLPPKKQHATTDVNSNLLLILDVLLILYNLILNASIFFTPEAYVSLFHVNKKSYAAMNIFFFPIIPSGDSILLGNAPIVLTIMGAKDRSLYMCTLSVS